MTDPVRSAAVGLVASAQDEGAQRASDSSDLFIRNLAVVGRSQLDALVKVLEDNPPGDESEAPLAQTARLRLAAIVRGLAEPMMPADLRDGAIAVAALTAAIEDLEEQDGRVYVKVGEVRRWVGNLLDLVALVGEPPAGAGDEAERVYWSAVEGPIIELAELLPDTERPAVPTSMTDDRPGPGGGLFATVAVLEGKADEERHRADDEHRRARIEVEEAERRLRDRAVTARNRVEAAIRSDDANLSRATIEELRAAVAALEEPSA